MLNSIIKHNTKRIIFTSFLSLVFFFFLPQHITAQKKYVVVLDAGHGGRDPGKVAGRKYKEKNIALKITLLIGKYLKKEKDIKIIYTRKTDKFVNLWKRGEIANKAKADLFVSIHCNAHRSQASGAETWVLGLHANKKNFEVAKQENSVILLEENHKERYNNFNPNSPESVISLTLMQEENLDKSLLLASIVQSNFKLKLKRKNRGVKQAGFVVLHQTYMPSILIETGFITNKNEGRYLYSKKGQTRMAKSIAASIKRYIYQLKINTVTDTEINNHVAQKKKSINKVSSDILFKVQIASSKRKLVTKAYNFKKLKGVKRVKVGSIYRYYYGNTSDYQEIKTALSKAKAKGYRSAFIVAYKNGKRISVSKALKN